MANNSGLQAFKDGHRYKAAHIEDLFTSSKKELVEYILAAESTIYNLENLLEEMLKNHLGHTTADIRRISINDPT